MVRNARFGRMRLGIAALLLFVAQLYLPSGALVAYNANDVETAVNRLKEHNIIQGVDNNGNLALDATVTRAELVTILVRAYGQDQTAKLSPGSAAFPDTQGHWASGYVALAKQMVEQNGGQLGMPDGRFNPNGKLTSPEALLMMMKFMGVKPDTTLSWPDSYIQGALNAGLISADEAALFAANANNPATRGLTFYLADQAFSNYKLADGKTVYNQNPEGAQAKKPTDPAQPENSPDSSDENGKNDEGDRDGDEKDPVDDSRDHRDVVLKPVSVQHNAEGDRVHLELVREGAPVLKYNLIGEMPPGLRLEMTDTNDGLISGTVAYSAVAADHDVAEYRFTVEGIGTFEDDSVTIIWKITNVDTKPTMETLTNRTDVAGEAVSFKVSGADADGDRLQYTASGLPNGVTINAETGEISGTPEAGEYPVTITVSDNTPGGPNGDSAASSFVWEVQAPGAVTLEPIGNQTNAEGDTVTLGVYANGQNKQHFVYSVTGLPPELTFDSIAQEISGPLVYHIADAENPSKSYEVVVTVTDAVTGESDSETFTWTVNNTDTTPTLHKINETLRDYVDTDIYRELNASDIDGDHVTFRADGLPEGLTLDENTGVISGRLTSPVTVTVTITVTDDTPGGPGGDSDSDSFEWQIILEGD